MSMSYLLLILGLQTNAPVLDERAVMTSAAVLPFADRAACEQARQLISRATDAVGVVTVCLATRSGL